MQKYLLLLICAFFLLTRFFQIQQNPPALYWDEASIGYNAYSVALTGRDEWGNFLPIHFRAFGEFKLPVYIYSVVPFVKILGLNALAVRFPAVLYSLGTVLLVYLLAKRIFNNEWIGLWSSFLMSISSWFFIFSRTGYEVSAGLMFYLLGIYLFLRLTDNKWFIFLSTLSFILSAYSYNSFRVITPITFLLLIVILPKKQKIKKKLFLPFLAALILVIISAIPIYRLYKYDAGNSRFQAVGVGSASVFLKNYLAHFNPIFLFISGDKNLRSEQPGFGQLYPAEAVLILLGLIYILRKKEALNLLPVAFLLIAPIPAALTKESPHALRSLSETPFLAMISAAGAVWIGDFFKNRYIEIAFVLILLGYFTRYYINFVTLYPVEASADWQYGYKQIYTDFGNEFPKYNNIIVSDEYGQPYIFALFYLKYDPESFTKSVVRNSVDDWGFSTVAQFGKFRFSKINPNNLSSSSLIFSDKEIPQLIPSGSIKLLDNTTAFWIYRL